MGGAFYIHTFAAFFGVAATWLYSPKSNWKNNPNIVGTYSSTTLAFLGTFILWVFSPSFNSVNPKH